MPIIRQDLMWLSEQAYPSQRRSPSRLFSMVEVESRRSLASYLYTRNSQGEELQHRVLPWTAIRPLLYECACWNRMWVQHYDWPARPVKQPWELCLEEQSFVF